MYVLGYFSLDLDDSLGWGYGYFNLNLNSFFNPLGQTNLGSFSWSTFLPIRNYQNGEIEGFSYLGISGIVFFIIFILNIFLKKYYIIYTNKKLILICVLFFFLAISNNINIGKLDILTIPINNFFYAILSSIRASGRLIWPVYYLVFIVGIVFIYKNFNKKISFIVILSLLFIQIIDLSKGLNNYKFGKQYSSSEKNIVVKNKIWHGLSNNFSQIRLLEPKNQSKIYQLLSKILSKENFLKTDIIYLARVNRKIITNEKYELIKLFNEKNLDIFNDTVFISDNVNSIKYLQHIYKEELYYYNIDNLWIISKKSINQNISENPELLKDDYVLNLSKNETITFENKNLIPGLGWKLDDTSNGLILDGFRSGILIKIIGEQCNVNSYLKLKIDKYYSNLNDPIKLKLFINGKEKKDLIIDKKNKNLSVIFDCINRELNSLLFVVDEPKSLFDLKRGLNRNKRSIILKSISVIN
jgi:hypothetical protein